MSDTGGIFVGIAAFQKTMSGQLDINLKIINWLSNLHCKLTQNVSVE